MNDGQPIRVLVVDDHPMVRKGLAAFLMAMDGFALVGEAKDGADALRQCEATKPDIVLMDMVMPELDGPAATGEIRRRWPATQVVAITSFKEEALVHLALRAGAIGYLLKDVTADELEEALRAAHAGRPTLAPSATEALIHSAVDEPRPEYNLTPREVEVLALMVDGLNNRQIADRLFISPATASVHVSNILAKLGVSNRVEAVTMALREGLVG